MKLWAVFRFELTYQARRAWPWLFFAVLLVVSFLMARDRALADALYDDFFANSPFAIATTTVFGGLIWLLVAPAVAGDAAARDVATGMHPLTYTASVSKGEYLGGRFLAALVLNAVLLLAVQAGILLGVYSPGVDAEVIGPFRPAASLTAYAFIALPNAFVATALQFALAAKSGRAMSAYVGSLLLIFMGFFVASLLFFKRGLGPLLDPIGIRFIVEDLAHLWTTTEKSWRLLALDGTLQTNRLLWLALAIAVLAVTYLRFRLAHRTERSLIDLLRSLRSRVLRRDGGRVQGAMPAGFGVIMGTRVVVPDVPRAFGLPGRVRQVSSVAWDSFRTTATSWAGLALLGAIPPLTVLVVLDQLESMGAPLMPTTARVITELTAPLSAELSRWVIVPLLIVFFAGELVWRERDAGVAELTDAMPRSEWVPLCGKFLGLGLVLALFMAHLTVAGVLAQVIRGHQDLEIGLYLKILFGLQLPEYLLFAVLALVVHVLVNQKYVGHLVAVLAYVFIAVLAPMFGIEHNLLVYGAGPSWSYTEMRGFGASLGPWLWFKLYWLAWALLLVVGARLFWMRGREKGIGVRLRLARGRLAGPTAWLAGAAASLVLIVGGFIFYNTNVQNEYLSASTIAERRAEYERRYRRYENIPQPRLAATTLRVEIYPDRRAVDIRGSYRLVNGTGQRIESVHLATAAGGAETRAVTFDRSASVTVNDEEHGYRIYALETPLEPGDTLRLDFEVRVERRGFGNRGIDPTVAASGSYFTSGRWFPFIGYQRQRELLSPADRRAHGLPPRPVIAPLDDVGAREPATRGGGIAFEAVVGTDEDQVAVAPGALRRTWIEGASASSRPGRRRYFHYSTDAPIGTEWSFFSARYAVREGRWRDVAIQFFHHPAHTSHLDRTMQSVRASLDYYTGQFGPYPYRHLTIVEHPGAPGTGLHADATMISHGQGFPCWRPRDEANGLDFPYAVMAHEMAHQWTLPYAFVEGAPFLSEGLAWYSAMQVVKQSRGLEQLRRLLAFMRQPHPYPPIRRGEPLLRALDPYLSYRKGPFAMYALSEYVGSDRVNGALRTLIERHDAPGAPLATTLDLYRELQAVTPDALRYLLHDLFEVNASWQFATERVTAVPTPEGSWKVTLDVRARKTVYDTAGLETEVSMDEWVPIGIFGPAASGASALSVPLYLEKHRIRSGRQTITVTLPRHASGRGSADGGPQEGGKPVLAGLDPFHLLDWEAREDEDNIGRVDVVGRGEERSVGR